MADGAPRRSVLKGQGACTRFRPTEKLTSVEAESERKDGPG